MSNSHPASPTLHNSHTPSRPPQQSHILPLTILPVRLRLRLLHHFIGLSSPTLLCSFHLLQSESGPSPYPFSPILPVGSRPPRSSIGISATMRKGPTPLPDSCRYSGCICLVSQPGEDLSRENGGWRKPKWKVGDAAPVAGEDSDADAETNTATFEQGCQSVFLRSVFGRFRDDPTRTVFVVVRRVSVLIDVAGSLVRRKLFTRREKKRGIRKSKKVPVAPTRRSGVCVPTPVRDVRDFDYVDQEDLESDGPLEEGDEDPVGRFFPLGDGDDDGDEKSCVICLADAIGWLPIRGVYEVSIKIPRWFCAHSIRIPRRSVDLKSNATFARVPCRVKSVILRMPRCNVTLDSTPCKSCRFPPTVSSRLDQAVLPLSRILRLFGSLKHLRVSLRGNDFGDQNLVPAKLDSKLPSTLKSFHFDACRSLGTRKFFENASLDSFLTPESFACEEAKSRAMMLLDGRRDLPPLRSDDLSKVALQKVIAGERLPPRCSSLKYEDFAPHEDFAPFAESEGGGETSLVPLRRMTGAFPLRFFAAPPPHYFVRTIELLKIVEVVSEGGVPDEIKRERISSFVAHLVNLRSLQIRCVTLPVDDALILVESLPQLKTLGVSLGPVHSVLPDPLHHGLRRVRVFVNEDGGNLVNSFVSRLRVEALELRVRTKVAFFEDLGVLDSVRTFRLCQPFKIPRGRYRLAFSLLPEEEIALFRAIFGCFPSLRHLAVLSINYLDLLVDLLRDRSLDYLDVGSWRFLQPTDEACEELVKKAEEVFTASLPPDSTRKFRFEGSRTSVVEFMKSTMIPRAEKVIMDCLDAVGVLFSVQLRISVKLSGTKRCDVTDYAGYVGVSKHWSMIHKSVMEIVEKLQERCQQESPMKTLSLSVWWRA